MLFAVSLVILFAMVTPASSATKQTTQLYLQTGWNMISLPFVLEITNDLTITGCQIERILDFNPDEGWKLTSVAENNKETIINALSKPGKGFLVYNSAPECSVAFTGMQAKITDTNLPRGWNLLAGGIKLSSSCVLHEKAAYGIAYDSSGKKYKYLEGDTKDFVGKDGVLRSGQANAYLVYVGSDGCRISEAIPAPAPKVSGAKGPDLAVESVAFVDDGKGGMLAVVKIKNVGNADTEAGKEIAVDIQQSGSIVGSASAASLKAGESTVVLIDVPQTARGAGIIVKADPKGLIDKSYGTNNELFAKAPLCVPAANYDVDGSGDATVFDYDICIQCSGKYSEKVFYRGFNHKCKRCDFNGDCNVDSNDIKSLSDNIPVSLSYFIIGPPVGEIGTLITVSAHVSSSSYPVSATADIKLGGTRVHSMSLYDDGEHGDEKPNDRLYANVWDSSRQKEGDYTVTITVTDSKGQKSSASRHMAFLMATDTDKDGMTDLAEIIYGFDPKDAESFPKEPEVIKPVLKEPERFPIDGSGIGAYYQLDAGAMIIGWGNPQDGTYSLSLKTADAGNWNIYYGGHPAENALVSLEKFNLKGTERLVGKFTEYSKDLKFVKSYEEFELDLSSVRFPTAQEKELERLAEVGAPSNKISYTFSPDFPKDSEIKYRDFLKKALPIMYAYLGPPSETFNIVIKYTGERGDFMTVDNGRTVLTDADFIPRLIVHELVHAWKGSYTISRDANWVYDSALTGFEEATAEGMAFEIVQEYARSYPNDPATVQLLDKKPYQYWSGYTTFYDSIKHLRSTGAGDFWTNSGGQRPRYSIVATTFQMMIRENPKFMKDFMSIYYKKIRENPDWRPNRDGIIRMWENLVPEMNGYLLRKYIASLPVFNGRKLDKGIYVLNTIKPYGKIGDQQFAVGYANEDGMLWWGAYKDKLDVLPKWIKTSIASDGMYYPDMQNSPFTIEIVDAYGYRYPTYNFKTPWERDPDGSPQGLGWYMPSELAMEKFPLGLYRETVTFTDYIKYDKGASETLYFFGLKDFEQDKTDYVIMIGIDGVTNGTAQIVIGDEKYTSPIINGVAVLKSKEWGFNLDGKFSITITDTNSITRNYYRTIVKSGTIHGYCQQQFIIIDTDFNGIEDQFEKRPV